MNFFIGIPTVNRADLLNEALKKYVIDFPNTKIIIVDNGRQNIWRDHKNIWIAKQQKNLGVAGSWNLLLKHQLKIWDNALILNDDIYLGKTEEDINVILELFENDDMILGKGVNWSVFLIRKRLVEQIGYFDENIYPAYFEDNDFAYRMYLAGKTKVNTEMLNPVIYRNSMTIQKNPELNHNFEKNRQYYISKWGGEPTKETFTKPFNK